MKTISARKRNAIMSGICASNTTGTIPKKSAELFLNNLEHQGYTIIRKPEKGEVLKVTT